MWSKTTQADNQQLNSEEFFFRLIQKMLLCDEEVNNFYFITSRMQFQLQYSNKKSAAVQI